MSATKVTEFFGHTSNINCGVFGHTTAGIMATGSDDCRVNIWRLGKTQPLSSLIHPGEIDSVRFGLNDDMIACGNRAGTVKVWDIAGERLIRNLPGHRASVRDINFHPYGNFLSSGSLDTNIKVFDLRGKNCIHTYKGHTAAITKVRHSPDGRWIVSADAVGVVRIWDLTQGKLVKEFKSTKREPVTTLEFHPNEYVLVFSAGEKCVQFWDLETFQLADSTSREATPIQSIQFSRDGNSLLEATPDALKVWQWEPLTCCDVVDLSSMSGWRHTQDMSVTPEDQLISLSFHKTLVSVVSVDLTELDSFSGGDNEQHVKEEKYINNNIDNMTTSFNQMNVNNMNTTPTSSSNRPNTTDGYEQQQRQQSPREQQYIKPTITTNITENMSDRGETTPVSKKMTFAEIRQRMKQSKEAKLQQHKDNITSSPRVNIQHNNKVQTPTNHHHIEPKHNSFFTNNTSNSQHINDSLSDSRNADDIFFAPDLNNSNNNTIKKQQPIIQHSPIRQSSPHERKFNVIPLSPTNSNNKNRNIDNDKPIGLDVHDFLPADHQDNMMHSMSRINQEDIRKAILSDNVFISTILNTRLNHMRVIRRFWATGNIDSAIETCVKAAAGTSDLSVVREFLKVLGSVKGPQFTLDCAKSVIPLIKKMIASQFESDIQAGLEAVCLIVRSFGELIINTRIASKSKTSLSIAGEERLGKCNLLYTELSDIYMKLNNILSRYPDIRILVKETSIILKPVISST